MMRKHKVFISYSSKDEGIVRQFIIAIQNKGIKCWFAPDEIKHGEYGDKIIRSIRSAGTFLIFCSSFSVGNRKNNIAHSAHCLRELKIAEKNQKSVIALSLDEALPSNNESEGFEYHLTSNYNWIDIRQWVAIEAYEGFANELIKLIESGILDNKDVDKASTTALISRAMNYMKEGRWSVAKKCLRGNFNSPNVASLAHLLSIACGISEKGIARLSKEEADAFFEQLSIKLEGPYKAMASYILLCLLEDYYRETSTVTPRNAGELQKAIAQIQQREKLKYGDLKAFHGVPRNYVKFNSTWFSK
jgi:hypothetical protein